MTNRKQHNQKLSDNLREEHNCIDVMRKQVPQLPMLHPGACTNQMKEYKELTSPLQHSQNTEDRTLQEKKGPLQQVLSSFYPEDIISTSISSEYITKIEYWEATK